MMGGSSNENVRYLFLEKSVLIIHADSAVSRPAPFNFLCFVFFVSWFLFCFCVEEGKDEEDEEALWVCTAPLHQRPLPNPFLSKVLTPVSLQKSFSVRIARRNFHETAQGGTTDLPNS